MPRDGFAWRSVFRGGGLRALQITDVKHDPGEIFGMNGGSG